MRSWTGSSKSWRRSARSSGSSDIAEGTWDCPQCGQSYSLDEPACTVCRITRENRHVIGRITKIRTPKPPPEMVEVVYPVFIKEARFNLPLDKGAVWSSGTLG